MRARSLLAGCLTVCVWTVSAVSTAQQPTTLPPTATTQAPTKAPAKRRSLVPDTFTNLQVLPKDIRKDELVEIMRNFCFTMDQRCSYCHVATDDLSEADFPADDKEPKKKARELLRLILSVKKEAPKPQS